MVKKILLFVMANTSPIRGPPLISKHREHRCSGHEIKGDDDDHAHQLTPTPSASTTCSRQSLVSAPTFVPAPVRADTPRPPQPPWRAVVSNVRSLASFLPFLPTQLSPVRGPTTDGIFLRCVCCQSPQAPWATVPGSWVRAIVGLCHFTLARRRRCRVPHLPICFRSFRRSLRRGCLPKPSRRSLRPMRCCSWPAIRATAATASSRACSRSA